MYINISKTRHLFFHELCFGFFETFKDFSKTLRRLNRLHWSWVQIPDHFLQLLLKILQW